MKSILTITILLFAGSFFFGCSGSSPVGPRGSYQYASFDTTGSLLVQGWMTIEVQGATVTGEWHFEKVSGGDRIGPQVGDGELIGNLDQGSLFISLNPNWVDNNIFLSGTFADGRFTGEWTYSSLIGLTNRGVFEAVKS